MQNRDIVTITPFTRYNRLSNRFDNGVERTATVRATLLNEQPLFVQPVVTPGCTTGLTTGCIHDTAGCQTCCQTGLTTGWMFVYTIQPVVKPDNRFDNRLYRVNGAYGTLIGTRRYSIDWCYFQWPWVTLTTRNHPIFDILYRLSYLRSEWR